MEPGHFTKGGHYILAYGVENGNILVNDPASTVRVKASVSIFEQQCKQYFVFTRGVAIKVDFDEALEVLEKKAGISAAYWKPKKDIDPYFDDLMIKIAEAWK